jgi:hypothetical protein
VRAAVPGIDRSGTPECREQWGELRLLWPTGPGLEILRSRPGFGICRWLRHGWALRGVLFQPEIGSVLFSWA